MTLVIPNAAEEAFLDLILAEGYTLRLFTNDVESGLTDVQIEALTAGSFTEATFTGYSSIALTGGSWVTTQGDDHSTGTYAQQTFTRTATGTGQTIQGYYVTRTTGGALRWYEYLPGPVNVINNGDTIRITPTLTLEEDREATVHARGVIARQTLTNSSGPHANDVTTDMVLNNVVVDSTRLYKVHFKSEWVVTAGVVWDIYLYVDGVLTENFVNINTAGAISDTANSVVLWEPASGTLDLEIRLDLISGGSLTLTGSADTKRQFWVEDVGAR